MHTNEITCDVHGTIIIMIIAMLVIWVICHSREISYSFIAWLFGSGADRLAVQDGHTIDMPYALSSQIAIKAREIQQIRCEFYYIILLFFHTFIFYIYL